MIIIPFSTIFIALNFGTLVTLLWRMKHQADKFLKDLKTHVTETVNHAKDVVISNTDGAENQLETFVAQQVEHSKNAVTTQLTAQSDVLTKSVSAVEAHSKAVIDARTQQVGSASVPRAECPECHRVCYKFQRRASGEILRCQDCAAK